MFFIFKELLIGSRVRGKRFPAGATEKLAKPTVSVDCRGSSRLLLDRYGGLQEGSAVSGGPEQY